MPPLVVVSSDEALLALEAAGRVTPECARTRLHRARGAECGRAFRLVEADAGHAGDCRCSPSGSIVEVRLPTGKPGVAGAAALEALAESVPADTLHTPRPPEARPQDPRGALGQRTRTRGHLVGHRDDRARPLAAVDRRAPGATTAECAAPMRLNSSPIESKAICSPRIRRSPSLRCCIRPANLSLDQVRDAVLNVARYDVSQLQAAMVGGDRTRVAKTMAGLRDEGEALPLIIWAIAEELRALIRVKALVAGGRPFAAAARENRVWGPRERLFERALRTPRSRPPGAHRDTDRRHRPVRQGAACAEGRQRPLARIDRHRPRRCDMTSRAGNCP